MISACHERMVRLSGTQKTREVALFKDGSGIQIPAAAPFLSITRHSGL